MTMWLVDWIWPRRCEICSQEGRMVCEKCLAGLSRAVEKCPGCYRNSAGGLRHKGCDFRSELLGLTSLYAYKDLRVARLVQSMKYEGRWAVMEELVMGAKRPGMDIDVVSYIPMHWWKANIRGFNQARMLALCLSKKWDIPVLEGLKRRLGQGSMAATSSARERRKMVQGVYRYEGRRLDGRSILLVDDVFTTGATMNEVARQLKMAGVGAVWGWSLCS